MSGHRGARELIDLVLDAGSFGSWDEPCGPPPGANAAYRADLDRAGAAAGTDEAVLTGSGRVAGQPVAVVVSEFRFLGGSVGAACAARIESAVRRATAQGLPLLAAPASGGTRMQEGTPAFVRMIGITAAITAHRAAGLPYLVYLRHPTMGGVFASWGSLGHLTVAEPGARLGFLGPKVYAALHGAEFPDGVQTAENLARNGLVDAVVPAELLAPIAARALRHLAPAVAPAPPPPVTTGPRAGPAPQPPDIPAWDAVLRTRESRRPGVREVLRYAATEVLPLSGTGEGEAQPGLVTALAGLAGVSCVLVGQDRHAQSRTGALGPAALRQARRSIRIAAELRLPLVTVIDTPGASLSRAAEEGGLSGEIARCLADLLELPSPTVAVLLGAGGGGAALALLPGDRLIAAADAWLSPLPPEGSSALVHHGDTGHAAELAGAQRIGARHLAEDGLLDAVVPAPEDPAVFAHAVAAAVAAALTELAAEDPAERLARRPHRFSGNGRTRSAAPPG